MPEARKRSASRESTSRNSDMRLLTVRLSPATYEFLVAEGYELAIENGANEEDVKNEAEEIRQALAMKSGKARGLISFSDVVDRALDVLMNFCRLSAVSVARLQRDQEALRQVMPGGHLSRFQYLQLVLFARSEEVARKGPGYDKQELVVGGK